MTPLHNKLIYGKYIESLVPRQRNFRRTKQHYCHAVINPPAISPGQLYCLRVCTAWMHAVSALTGRRKAKVRLLAVADEIFNITRLAPHGIPFEFSRLDAERLVIDAAYTLNHSRVRG
jgi:hypothetical protein